VIYFAIFLIPFVMNPFGFQYFGIVKVCFFLAILGLALGWYGVQIVRRRAVELRVNKGVLVFLLFWVLSFFLSVLFSLNPAQSLFGEYFYLKGALFYLFVAVHFLICWKVFSEKGLIDKFLKVVKWVGLGVAVYSIVQYFFLDPEVVGRVYGTIGNPNFLAQFLIFPLFVVLFERGKWWKWLFLGVILLAVFMTGSRAVMLGVLVSLYLWFLFYGKLGKVWKLVFSLGLVAIVVGGLLLLDFDMRSVNSRLLLWGSIGDLVNLRDFVFGSGIETFARRYAEVMPKEVFEYENFFTTANNMHNEVLHSFVERGIVGMVLYLIPVGFLIWSLFWKKVKDLQMVGFALLAYIISVQFSFSTVVHYVFLAAFWAVFLMGVLKSDYKVKLKNVVIGVLLICVSAAILFSSFSLMRSDFLLRKGMDEYVIFDQNAYEVFEKAAESSLVYAYPYELIVNFYATEKALSRYGRITEYDFEYNVLAMGVAFINQKTDEMLFYYLRGVNASPNYPVLYVNAGIFYYSIRECDKAIHKFEILESLAPDYEKGTEEYRLFIKHAYGFEDAMNLLETCRAEVAED
jgi:O-antigen ligase